jgi:hypothetical protein
MKDHSTNPMPSQADRSGTILFQDPIDRGDASGALQTQASLEASTLPSVGITEQSGGRESSYRPTPPSTNGVMRLSSSRRSKPIGSMNPGPPSMRSRASSAKEPSAKAATHPDAPPRARAAQAQSFRSSDHVAGTPADHAAYTEGRPNKRPESGEVEAIDIADKPLSEPAPSPSPFRSVPLVGTRKVTTIPSFIRSTAEHAANTTIKDAQIERGAHVDQMAKRLKARAFAAQGSIFVPERHGSMSSGEGAALLAHELVHVAQQRKLGRLPYESSVAGRRLEAQAAAAETAVASAVETQPRHLTASEASSPTPVAPPVMQGIVQRAPQGPMQNAAPDQDINDVMDRVYEAVRSRLRDELRLDRERTGRLTEIP